MKRAFLNDWIFPSIAFFMVATLMITFLLQTPSLSMSQLVAFSSSFFAYSFMLVGLFIASRPRFLEKHIGMPRMYEVHAVMTLLACILVVIHIVLIWQGFSMMFRSTSTIFGYLGSFSMALGLFSGALSLSGMFIQKYPRLLYLKEKVFNREIMLWMHRIGGLGAIIFVYLHQFYIPFLRNNMPYMVVMTVYTVGALGYYAYWKFTSRIADEFVVSKIYKATPSLWVLEFRPQQGQIPAYNPGDYFFIHFTKAEGITKEGHPFSTSSAITKVFPNSIEFMIKEAGDWTKSLANVKVGDKARLEGNYGDFLPKEVHESDRPFVLMGGGIGLTPNLSILRHEMDQNSNRRIHLVWALSYEEDMFMLDELNKYKAEYPNFDYDIIFSNEEVEGYAFGFISEKFLTDIEVNKLGNQATYFICGPDIMMYLTKEVLLNMGIDEEHIRLDEFGF